MPTTPESASPLTIAVPLWQGSSVADANTVISSPSGAVHGMAARIAMAESPERLVYLGVRATDPEEQRWIDEHAIPVLPVDAPVEKVLAGLDGASAVHIHLDLDVLDPMHFTSVDLPEPYGVRPDHLTAILATVAEALDIRCASVMECSAATKQRHLDKDRATLAAMLEPLR
ncbi:arginase family protein [Euzebya rosea]|uniref:arginase family protein n=1 Tax=Euzebya rosea TaxID=2052804 RepID=UPI000D3E4C40|nr:arginase family protein [Euzebya rosea]